jgi:hypothetical protein
VRSTKGAPPPPSLCAARSKPHLLYCVRTKAELMKDVAAVQNHVGAGRFASLHSGPALCLITLPYCRTAVALHN